MLNILDFKTNFSVLGPTRVRTNKSDLSTIIYGRAQPVLTDMSDCFVLALHVSSFLSGIFNVGENFHLIRFVGTEEWRSLARNKLQTRLNFKLFGDSFVAFRLSSI